MRTALFILLMICWCLGSPVSEHGTLSFNDDGLIVDENNNVVQIRGMSMFWDKWGYEEFYNQKVIETLASTGNNGWGATVVRAAISEKNVDRAKSMIDWAIGSGIYVIIDNHSHCAHTETEKTGKFFQDVSAYVAQMGYKGKVLYELYNEPLYNDCSGGTRTSWTTIKAFAESVIPKIRANDEKGMILVGTPYYSQGIGDAGENPIKGVSNVGYVLHFYASDSGHERLKGALRRARCKKIPTFITEWGVSEASGDGKYDDSMVKSWLAWIEGLGFSWANWSISDKGETSAAIAGNGGRGGDWSESQLTASGKFVRRMIKGLNAGQSLSSLDLSTPTYTDCSIYEGPSEYTFERTGMGSFDKRIDAEDYLDSNNIVTETDKNTNAYNGMYITTTNSSGAWASYQMSDVPADGYYTIAIRYLAGNGDVVLKYSVNDVEQSVTLEKTTSDKAFNVVFAPVSLKAGDAMVKFDLGGVSASDLKFDAFWVTNMDSSDSVNFGFLKVDENGNRIVTDKPVEQPKKDTTTYKPLEPPIVIPTDNDKEVADAIFASTISKMNLRLHGRLLEVSGIRSDAVLNVFDMQGRVLLKRAVQGAHSVDLSRLQSGAYLVQVKGVGLSETKRIQLR